MPVHNLAYSREQKDIVEWRTDKDGIEHECITEAAAWYHSASGYAASGSGHARCSRLGATDRAYSCRRCSRFVCLRDNGCGWSRSGGTEATLLQLIHLLLAHGMLFVGLPWSDRMRRSGSYYGATAHGEVTEDDREQARALGRRVAETALRVVAGQRS